jgi:hypothetical protein
VNPVIRFQDQALINFRHHAFTPPSHHGYRWIDIKRFRMPADPLSAGPLSADPLPDDRALHALIGDEQFADGYAGAGVDPTGTIHGPYQLAHVTADAYERLDAEAAVSVIDRWARQFGDLPGTLVDVLEEQVYAPIRRARVRYRLGKLDKSALHEWAGIHTEFHEFVIMDEARKALLVIVAADD